MEFMLKAVPVTYASHCTAPKVESMLKAMPVTNANHCTAPKVESMLKAVQNKLHVALLVSGSSFLTSESINHSYPAWTFSHIISNHFNLAIHLHFYIMQFGTNKATP
jgi:hypothetical protein